MQKIEDEKKEREREKNIGGRLSIILDTLRLCYVMLRCAERETFS